MLQLILAHSFSRDPFMFLYFLHIFTVGINLLQFLCMPSAHKLKGCKNHWNKVYHLTYLSFLNWPPTQQWHMFLFCLWNTFYSVCAVGDCLSNHHFMVYFSVEFLYCAFQSGLTIVYSAFTQYTLQQSILRLDVLYYVLRSILS